MTSAQPTDTARLDIYARDFPALDGRTIHQGHADYCEIHGHATTTLDGIAQLHCPRCGEVKDAGVTATTVTRRPVGARHYRYEANGEVVTARSTRLYTWASIYRNHTGGRVVYLHSRADLAAAGNATARYCGFAQVGIAQIVEVTA